MDTTIPYPNNHYACTYVECPFRLPCGICTRRNQEFGNDPYIASAYAAPGPPNVTWASSPSPRPYIPPDPAFTYVSGKGPITYGSGTGGDAK